MDNKAFLAVAIVFFAVALGATIFWWGMKQGADKTKEGLQLAYGGLIGIDGPQPMIFDDSEIEAKRRIGFRPEDRSI